MAGLFESVSDLRIGSDIIRRRSYGVIEVVGGELQRVVFRPWPKIISLPEVRWIGGRAHQRKPADFCRLFFNQPSQHRNFLALKYVVSNYSTTFRTFRRAIVALDQIAQIKQIDAIVCEVTNDQISDRLMTRWGWEPHLLESRRRQFIKRFYGDYGSVEKIHSVTSDRPLDR